jgi:hypothetical protein
VVNNSICMLQNVSYVLRLRNASDSSPVPCCYMLDATMPCSLVIVIMLMLSIKFTIYTSVQSYMIALLLGGEVNLVLRCASRGVFPAAVACAYLETLVAVRYLHEKTKCSRKTTYLRHVCRNCISQSRSWHSLYHDRRCSVQLIVDLDGQSELAIYDVYGIDGI